MTQKTLADMTMEEIKIAGNAIGIDLSKNRADKAGLRQAFSDHFLSQNPEANIEETLFPVGPKTPNKKEDSSSEGQVSESSQHKFDKSKKGKKGTKGKKGKKGSKDTKPDKPESSKPPPPESSSSSSSESSSDSDSDQGVGSHTLGNHSAAGLHPGSFSGMMGILYICLTQKTNLVVL